jgi:hypothetical protein
MEPENDLTLRQPAFPRKVRRIKAHRGAPPVWISTASDGIFHLPGLRLESQLAVGDVFL